MLRLKANPRAALSPLEAGSQAHSLARPASERRAYALVLAGGFGGLRFALDFPAFLASFAWRGLAFNSMWKN
jgi:hypothetical protein